MLCSQPHIILVLTVSGLEQSQQNQLDLFLEDSQGATGESKDSKKDDKKDSKKNDKQDSKKNDKQDSKKDDNSKKDNTNILNLFKCPTGNTSEWIQAVEINTVTKDSPGVDYLTGVEMYSPVHLMVKMSKTFMSTQKPQFGTASNKFAAFLDGKEVEDSHEIPSTFAPLGGVSGKTSDLKNRGDYFDGKFLSKKYGPDMGILKDDEQTYFFSLENGKCYVMASFVQTKITNRNNRFRGGMGVDEVRLRVLKFAVCQQGPDGHPKCADRKQILTCWYNLQGTWVKCGQDLLSAAIISRT